MAQKVLIVEDEANSFAVIQVDRAYTQEPG